MDIFWLQKQTTGYIGIKFQIPVRASDTHVAILNIQVVVKNVRKDDSFKEA